MRVGKDHRRRVLVLYPVVQQRDRLRHRRDADRNIQDRPNLSSEDRLIERLVLLADTAPRISIGSCHNGSAFRIVVGGHLLPTMMEVRRG
jgi:hypothetical protein